MKRLLALGVIFAALFVAPVQAAPLSARGNTFPTITVTPFTSTIGTTLSVTGVNFRPNVQLGVEIIWTNDGHVDTYFTTSDSGGNLVPVQFTAAFTGHHMAQVKQLHGGKIPSSNANASLIDFVVQ